MKNLFLIGMFAMVASSGVFADVNVKGSVEANSANIIDNGEQLEVGKEKCSSPFSWPIPTCPNE